MTHASDPLPTELDQDRLELLEQIEDWLDTPLLALDFLWLLLLIIELVWGLGPFLEGVGTVI